MSRLLGLTSLIHLLERTILPAVIGAALIGAYAAFPGPAAAEINVPPAPFPALPPTAALDPVVAADVAPPEFGGKGYHVSEIKPNSGVYWITDGNYHAMAVVHDDGVILVDAPEPLPFFPPLPVLAAIDEITDKDVTHLIYSHAHTDHIGGADDVLAAFPDVEIIAHEETKALLEKAADPRRPVPTLTFVDELDLSIGGQNLELSYHGNTHQEGNIFVYVPQPRILMVVDIIYPGWVPFRRLALSNDINGWWAGHDAVMSFNFKTLIGGHLTRLGDKDDVVIQMEYVQDIQDAIEEVYLDQNTLFAAAGAIDAVYGEGFAFSTVAKWALFSAFYDASTMHCSDILDAKYIEGANPGDNPDALGGAETFNFSNCEAWFVARRIGTVP